MDKFIEGKWLWMMAWCKDNKYPPAQSYYWDLAENAYEKRIREDKTILSFRNSTGKEPLEHMIDAIETYKIMKEETEDVEVRVTRYYGDIEITVVIQKREDK